MGSFVDFVFEFFASIFLIGLLVMVTSPITIPMLALLREAAKAISRGAIWMIDLPYMLKRRRLEQRRQLLEEERVLSHSVDEELARFETEMGQRTGRIEMED